MAFARTILDNLLIYKIGGGIICIMKTQSNKSIKI